MATAHAVPYMPTDDREAFWQHVSDMMKETGITHNSPAHEALVDALRGKDGSQALASRVPSYSAVVSDACELVASKRLNLAHTGSATDVKLASALTAKGHDPMKAAIAITAIGVDHLNRQLKEPERAPSDKETQRGLAAEGLALADTQVAINNQQRTLNQRWASILRHVDEIPGDPATHDTRSNVHAALLVASDYANDELNPSGTKPDAGNYATLALNLRNALKNDKSQLARALYPLAERAIQACEDQSDLIHLRNTTQAQWRAFNQEVGCAIPHLSAADKDSLKIALRWTNEVGRAQVAMGDAPNAPTNQTLSQIAQLLQQAAPQLTPAKLDPPAIQDPVWNMTNRSAMFLRMAQASERGIEEFPITRREDMAYLMDSIYGTGYGSATLHHFDAAARTPHGKNRQQLTDGFSLRLHVPGDGTTPPSYTVQITTDTSSKASELFRRASMRSENAISDQMRDGKQQTRRQQKAAMGIER